MANASHVWPGEYPSRTAAIAAAECFSAVGVSHGMASYDLPGGGCDRQRETTAQSFASRGLSGARSCDPSGMLRFIDACTNSVKGPAMGSNALPLSPGDS